MAHQTPAEVVIEEFGIRPLAKALDIDPSTVVRWRQRGGTIPSKYYPKLLELPGRALTPEDIIHGRELEDDDETVALAE